MTAGRKNYYSESYDWGTPKHYIDGVRRVFGGEIDLDPCSNPWSLVDAKVAYSLEHFDGLVESWNYSFIYVNPPYGKDFDRNTGINDWLNACKTAHKKYGSEVIALVPVAVNTGHWKRHVWGHACAICFLYATRLPFLVQGKHGGKGAPMACCMIYWGQHFETFDGVFIDFGAVVDIRNLHNRNIGEYADDKNGSRKRVSKDTLSLFD